MKQELPTIGLMTMSNNPRLTLNAIKEACSQNYPLDKITQYILYQKLKDGTYPQHYQTDSSFPIKLIQIDVPGEWPALWMFKIMMFFDHCRDELMAVWDEDDYYEPDYLKKAVDKLKAEPKLIAVWNFSMLFIRRGMIKIDYYNSAYGTLVGRTTAVRKAIQGFEHEHPNGLIREKRPESAGGGYVWHGPLDGPFRRYLVKMFPDKVGEHGGIRWYVFSETANTMLHGHRNPLESIDYGLKNMPECDLADIEYIKLKDGTKIWGINPDENPTD